jgi:hypothetical protein
MISLPFVQVCGEKQKRGKKETKEKRERDEKRIDLPLMNAF